MQNVAKITLALSAFSSFVRIQRYHCGKSNQVLDTDPSAQCLNAFEAATDTVTVTFRVKQK